MRAVTLLAAAALAAVGDGKSSPVLGEILTRKLDGSALQSYLSDKDSGAFAAYQEPSLNPRVARSLMAAALGSQEVYDGPEGCKVSNAARAWEGGQFCYLAPHKRFVKDGAEQRRPKASDPQLEKRTVHAGHPLRFAVKGPSSAEVS